VYHVKTGRVCLVIGKAPRKLRKRRDGEGVANPTGRLHERQSAGQLASLFTAPHTNRNGPFNDQFRSSHVTDFGQRRNRLRGIVRKPVLLQERQQGLDRRSSQLKKTGTGTLNAANCVLWVASDLGDHCLWHYCLGRARLVERAEDWMKN
jgi:hypothetical protein